MRTTMDPAKYSPSAAEAAIDIPASKSEPNSPRTKLRSRSRSSGPPPMTRTAINGQLEARVEACQPYRDNRCAKIPRIASKAMSVPLDHLATDVNGARLCPAGLRLTKRPTENLI